MENCGSQCRQFRAESEDNKNQPGPTSTFQGRVLASHDSYNRQCCKEWTLSLSAVMGGGAAENIPPESNPRHLHRGGGVMS
jgi:hypothetical protein